eukprot:722051-Pleurochrysis_carterae.AAC.1
MRWGGQHAHCNLVASPMRGNSASYSARLPPGTDNQQAKWRAGSRFACTRLNRERKLKVTERFRRIARHVSIGKGNGPVTPDLARCVAFALARGDLAPVACRERLQLSRRAGVLGGKSSDHPEQRSAREPGPLFRQVSDELSFAKAANVEQAKRGQEASSKERGFLQG